MIIIKTKFTNLFGQEVEQEHAFAMNTVEALTFKASFAHGNMEGHIKRIVAETDEATLLELVKELLLSSYGRIALDGNGFEKSPAIRAGFENSLAFPIIFEQVIKASNSGDMTFIEGIMPVETPAAVETDVYKPIPK